MLWQVICRNPFFKNAYKLLAIMEKTTIIKQKWLDLEKQADNKWVLLNINLDNLLYKV
jgi:hypothetical protein